ncbi:MAG: gamma-glutamyl-gamma-aminobutyrate hydrolase family protein [Nitrospiraceae bacterium]|nr:gamma-glutamyl-gamma-aminobutyrate hydrolase family protein [Nitrospiraceae bacterium]
MAAENERPLIGITAGPSEDGKQLCLKGDYARAVWESGGTPVLLPVNCGPQAYFSRVDGIIIPGGADIDPSYYGEKVSAPIKIVPSERTDFELSLIREALYAQQKKPLLAICYGMQLMNVALGGTLYQELAGRPAKDGLDQVEHKSGAHEITMEGSGFPIEGRFTVNSSHHQGVKKAGQDLCTVAYSDDGLIEGIYLKGHPFFAGFQWHPERMMDSRLSREIFSLFIKAANEKGR